MPKKEYKCKKSAVFMFEQQIKYPLAWEGRAVRGALHYPPSPWLKNKKVCPPAPKCG